MSYTITKTNGVTIGTILDGTIDNSKTSLTLIGRNYSNYGQFMVENLVSLVENFAYNIAPSNPLAGQIWWDTGNSLLKVYTGSTFKVIASCTAASVAPNTPVAGDQWWDTAEDQLYVYDGTSPYSTSGWVLVGPPWKKTKGKSGALWEQIVDTTSAVHDVVVLYLDGVRTAIISTDSEFTPNVAITGFTTVKQGLTSSTAVNGGQYFVTANNANYLGEQPASNYLRSDIDDVTSGSLTITDNNGLIIGATGNLQIATTTAGAVEITNTKSNGDITLYANVSGTSTAVLALDGSTGDATLRKLAITQSTAATNSSTGALVVAGGVGVAGDMYVAGDIVVNTLVGNASGTSDMVRSIVPITLGGTGANTAAQARDNLGVEIGVDVQQYNENLQAITEVGAQGIYVRTLNGEAAARTIIGGDNIDVANGSGQFGNPVVSVSDSPAFTGEPTVPTAPEFDDSLLIANTAFVKRAVNVEPLYAGVTSLSNIITTYISYPVGTKVAFLDIRGYGVGTGNGSAYITDLYRRVVKKLSDTNWVDVGAN